MINSTLGPILHHFEIWQVTGKKALIFPTLSHFLLYIGVTPVRFLESLTDSGVFQVADSEDSVILACIISSQYCSVTFTQTDSQKTPMLYLRQGNCILMPSKNGVIFNKKYNIYN